MAHQMAAAHTPDHDVVAALNEQISVKHADRATSGSCNACTPQTQATDYTSVTEVHLRGMSFRLCPACRKSLKRLL